MLVGRYLEDGCPEEDGVLMLNWGRGKGQTCIILWWFHEVYKCLLGVDGMACRKPCGGRCWNAGRVGMLTGDRPGRVCGGGLKKIPCSLPLWV